MVTINLIPGLSGDSPHDGSQEGKCRDCEETDPAWSQHEPYEQGKLGFILKCVHWRLHIATDSVTAYTLRFLTHSLHDGLTRLPFPFQGISIRLQMIVFIACN